MVGDLVIILMFVNVNATYNIYNYYNKTEPLIQACSLETSKLLNPNTQFAQTPSHCENSHYK